MDLIFFYLDRLLQYVPGVRTLSVKLFTDLQNFSRSPSIENSSRKSFQVRSLKISTTNNISINSIEDLLRHSCPNLEKLIFLFKIDAINHSCRDFIDDKRWENFLRSFVSLRDFRCAIEFPIDGENLRNQYATSFNANDFFCRQHWNLSNYIYTYSFNSILRLHTQPYPNRRLDIM